MTPPYDKSLADGFGRPIRYLRVSVTDRCNLRCRYCRSSAEFTPLSHADIISYEEITRLAGILAPAGVKSIRITGGEPFVRKNLDHLIRALSGLPGIEEVNLTTNGLLLENAAGILARAGLSRVNVSLDSLVPERFSWITRPGPEAVGAHPDAVLRGIEAARTAGLNPVKINVVLMRGFNDDELDRFATLTLGHDYEVRFIEFMPLSPEGFWGKELVVPTSEIIARLEVLHGSLTPVNGGKGSGPAVRYRIPGHVGTLGFISPVSNHFCTNCNRIRLTADGKLLACLFSRTETDLLTPMRSGISDRDLLFLIQEALLEKPAGHGMLDGGSVRACTRAMSHIGG
jgi:cyclic pyranopterin phosphate synthase